MNAITRIKRNNKEILVVDFSNCKEEQMIKIVSEVRSLLIAENKKQLILSIFNEKSYLTPKFMRHFEKDKREAILFIEDQAVIGFNHPKMMILKAYNFFFNRDIKAFNSQEEAIRYLLDDFKPSKVSPAA